MARGFSLHLARFRAAALAYAAAPEAAELDAFLTAAGERIARDLGTRSRSPGPGLLGSFPRLELWAAAGDDITRKGATRLNLAIRPLPQLRDSIEVTSVLRPVAIARPSIKGPNIAAYAELAASLGGEALLLDASGHVVEGTTTSLIWWYPDGTAGISATRERVPSVTERLVSDIARSQNVLLRPARHTPVQLAELDVWAVNALHGIRPVTGIDGRAPARHDPDRLNRYIEALERAWEPVADAPLPAP